MKYSKQVSCKKKKKERKRNCPLNDIWLNYNDFILPYSNNHNHKKYCLDYAQKLYLTCVCEQYW